MSNALSLIQCTKSLGKISNPLSIPLLNCTPCKMSNPLSLIQCTEPLGKMSNPLSTPLLECTPCKMSNPLSLIQHTEPTGKVSNPLSTPFLISQNFKKSGTRKCDLCLLLMQDIIKDIMLDPFSSLHRDI